MVTRRGLWSGLYGLIPGKGRPFGVLGAHAAERRSYTAADIDFLKAVGTTLGMAVSNSGERWMTISEIASTLQVNLETVRRWIRSGDLSAVLLGGTRTGYRIHSSELHRFTEQRLTG
jgi:excisionase family DNA binding protein